MLVPLSIRWIVGSLVVATVLSVGLAWSLTRSGLLDPHRLDLLMLGCTLLSFNLVIVPGLYWWDKRQARSGQGQRIPEVVLHMFAFAGGALSALLSQQLLRHKTRKRWFALVTWVALVTNAGLFYLGLGYFGYA